MGLISISVFIMTCVTLTCQRLKENLSHRVNERDAILTVGSDLIRQRGVAPCHKMYVVSTQSDQSVLQLIETTLIHCDTLCLSAGLTVFSDGEPPC